MAEFVFTGRLTFDGVEFNINAATKEEAIKKANRGDFDGYETVGAEATDWQIQLSTIKEV